MTNIRSQVGSKEIIIILLIIALVVPYYVPFTLPATRSSETTDTFNYIENLPEGSLVVVVGGAFAPEYWGELGNPAIAIISHLFERNMNLVFVSFGTDAPMMFKRTLDLINPRYLEGKIYGEDWVHLPFIPGSEVGMSSFANDCWISESDEEGRSLDDLPLMQSLRVIEDADLVVLIDTGVANLAEAIRQFQTRRPFIMGGVIGTYINLVSPYYESGQIIGFLGSSKGAFEYETLTGIIGPASKNMNALSLSHVLVLLLALSTNIPIILEKIGGGRK